MLPKLQDILISNKNKSGYVYDIETYPNFFCITFYNQNEQKQFEISSRKLELQQIIDFIENKVLIGYNNSKFDNIILNYLIYEQRYLSKFQGVEICKAIFDLAGRIIDYFQNNSQDESIKKYKYFEIPYFSIDLMQTGGFQKSLKLLAISLKWHRIQDLPYQWNLPLTEDKFEDVIKYNLNDVLITFELLKSMKDKLELRYNISVSYNLETLSDTDSQIANKIFEKLYSEKAVNKNFKDLRTHLTVVHLKDCIFPVVKFQTRMLSKMLNDLKLTSLYKKNNGFEFKFPIIEYKNVKYQLGIGGLHSQDEASKFDNSDYFLIDSDVTSYYPSIMINNKVKPSHLEDCFTDILKEIKDQRVQAKKEGNNVKSEALKIVINSVFGKLGFEGGFLYDDQAMISVTLNGQLLLLMLIEFLSLKDFEVISANTDGVITKVQKNRLEEYYQICREWEEITNLQLEYTFYKKYIRRDVNNYIVEIENGKIKSKGCFLQDIDLNKGYKFPVVSKILKKYYIDNLPLEKSLKEHKDIYDFCSSQKMGKQFTAEFDNQDIQNSVRFYVSNTGKKLLKYKFTEDGSRSYTDLCSGFNVKLFNDFEELENYQINYDFYLKELRKITGEINKVEETLW